MYGLALIIGRFQPFHPGHRALYERARRIARRVLFVIGSHRAPPSLRNPWTSEERRDFIRLSLGEGPYSFVDIEDSAYEFSDWLRRLAALVADNNPEGERVVVVGHIKDDTSYYLRHFPSWSVDLLPEQAGGLASAGVRNFLFGGDRASLSRHLPAPLVDSLLAWLETPAAAALMADFRAVRAFSTEAASARDYFLRAELCVVGKEGVLFGRRKDAPGAGRFSLPGVFFGRQASLLAAALASAEGLIEVRPREDVASPGGGAEASGARAPKTAPGRSAGPAPAGVAETLAGFLVGQKVFDQAQRDPRGRIVSLVFALKIPETWEVRLADPPSGRGGGAEITGLVWLSARELSAKPEEFFNDHGLVARSLLRELAL